MDIITDNNIGNNFLADSNNRIYILIGDTDNVIDKYLVSILGKIEFYYVYEITVEDSKLINTFVTSNLLCPIKNKFNIKIYHDYKKIIGSCILNVDGKFTRYKDPSKLYVYVFCYRYNNCLNTCTMIKCQELLCPEKEIIVDGYKINDMSFFYTNPEIIKQHTDIKNYETLYKNIFLRKELNRLILGKPSELLETLKEIVTIDSEDIWKVIVSNDIFDSIDVIKLINFDYDRNDFLSFVRAWYSNQLNNCKEDNDKIEKIYEIIENSI
ncbi:virion protein [Finch poxvirus]|uniref:Virion protein n=1 Tax=Condorpox virus TaxID=3049970 RepID=A0AAT9UNM4_9POXV|nr:virion protein [Finch poxvirus]UOX39201.1 virion protein [Finch poxvirus]